ncbi:MAG: DUF4157 domain-containing protein [Ruminococcaceae bacterium]|nr:DUF4157 domain-containing protein [Oscillospiraceae bacterium]
MGYNTYQNRRKSQGPTPEKNASSVRHVQSGYAPNSAYPGALDGGMGMDALRQAMRSKMASQFGSAYINPRAEAEADRIGSRFADASGVEDLKARMGSELGADFSAVRFHTGAEAAAKAPTAEDSFTAGKDIYMGGGFDPMIAAHEMVHTLQTGAVQATAAAVTSVPAGAVQGWDMIGSKGRGERTGTLSRMWNWTKKKWNGSGMVKAHRRAVDHYNNATEDFKDMSRWERFKWAAANPLAWMRGGGDTSKQETAERNAARQKEDEEAAKLAGMWSAKDLGDAAGKQGPNPAADDESDMPAARAEPTGVSVIKSATGLLSGKKNMEQDIDEGNLGSGYKESIDTVGHAANLATFGLGFVPGLGAVSNFINAGVDIDRAASEFGSAIGNGRTQSKMNKRVEAHADETKALEAMNPDEISEEDRYKLSRNRSMEQIREASRIRKHEGINNGVAQSIQAAGDTLGGMAKAGDFVIPGLGTLTGTAVSLGGTVLSAISSGIGNSIIGDQKKAMRKDTVNKELNIEQKIDALRGGDPAFYKKLGLNAEQASNLSRSEAKHIILKSMGFKSGKYKEAFNQITKNRARALTKRANEGGEEEIGMMKDMFLSKVDLGGGKQGYSTAGVARKMGYQNIDPEYFAGNNIFKKKAEENRAAKAKEEAEKKAKAEQAAKAKQEDSGKKKWWQFWK